MRWQVQFRWQLFEGRMVVAKYTKIGVIKTTRSFLGICGRFPSLFILQMMEAHRRRRAVSCGEHCLISFAKFFSEFARLRRLQSETC
jgi:hypothetical protein